MSRFKTLTLSLMLTASTITLAQAEVSIEAVVKNYSDKGVSGLRCCNFDKKCSLGSNQALIRIFEYIENFAKVAIKLSYQVGVSFANKLTVKLFKNHQGEIY